MYGGALPFAWGATGKPDSSLPRVCTSLGATSSGDGCDGLLERTLKRGGNLRAQPSAQRTFERLGRAFVVRPWSKNDNKAPVS